MPNPKENEMYQTLYDKGLNDREIAEKCSVDRRAVWSWRKKNGLPSKHYKRKNAVDHKHVREVIKANPDKFYREIAVMVGCSVGSVRRIGKIKNERDRWGQEDTGRGSYPGWKKYMTANPVYFESLFPNMTIREAWKQIDNIRLGELIPDGGDDACFSVGTFKREMKQRMLMGKNIK